MDVRFEACCLDVLQFCRGPFFRLSLGHPSCQPDILL